MKSCLILKIAGAHLQMLFNICTKVYRGYNIASTGRWIDRQTERAIPIILPKLCCGGKIISYDFQASFFGQVKKNNRSKRQVNILIHVET